MDCFQNQIRPREVQRRREVSREIDSYKAKLGYANKLHRYREKSADTRQPWDPVLSPDDAESVFLGDGLETSPYVLKTPPLRFDLLPEVSTSTPSQRRQPRLQQYQEHKQAVKMTGRGLRRGRTPVEEITAKRVKENSGAWKSPAEVEVEESCIANQKVAEVEHQMSLTLKYAARRLLKSVKRETDRLGIVFSVAVQKESLLKSPALLQEAQEPFLFTNNSSFCIPVTLLAFSNKRQKTMSATVRVIGYQGSLMRSFCTTQTGRNQCQSDKAKSPSPS